MKNGLEERKIEINFGKYKIVFEKESFYDSMFEDGRDKLTIKYLKQVRYGNSTVQQQLLTRIYERGFNNGVITNEFEQEYTYGLRNFIPVCNNQDKYAYFTNDSISYGINEITKKGHCKFFNGICFEGVPLANHLPFQFDIVDYPNLSDEKINSAMVFKGKTYDGLKYEIEIIKTDEEININYIAKQPIESDTYYIETKTVLDKQFRLPLLSKGKITFYELNNVIIFLENKIEKNDFLVIVLEELTNFRNKVALKRGMMSEKTDSLSPKFLIDVPLEEIEKMVNSNKEEYFMLVEEQFKSMTNDKNDLEGKKLILK